MSSSSRMIIRNFLQKKDNFRRPNCKWRSESPLRYPPLEESGNIVGSQRFSPVPSFPRSPILLFSLSFFPGRLTIDPAKLSLFMCSQARAEPWAIRSGLISCQKVFFFFPPTKSSIHAILLRTVRTSGSNRKSEKIGVGEKARNSVRVRRLQCERFFFESHLGLDKYVAEKLAVINSVANPGKRTGRPFQSRKI